MPSQKILGDPVKILGDLLLTPALRAGDYWRAFGAPGDWLLKPALRAADPSRLRRDWVTSGDLSDFLGDFQAWTRKQVCYTQGADHDSCSRGRPVFQRTGAASNALFQHRSTDHVIPVRSETIVNTTGFTWPATPYLAYVMAMRLMIPPITQSSKRSSS